MKNLDYRNMDLSGLDLSHRDFSRCLLTGADLRGANLSAASLFRAELTGVKVDEFTRWQGADIREATGIPLIPMVCPSEGAFFGWKAASSSVGPVLVKLFIPADARRSSGTTRSCRCDRAIVVSIEGADEAFSQNNPDVVYRPGDKVEEVNFDEDRWNNYGNGIYFFIDKEEAVDFMRGWWC